MRTTGILLVALLAAAASGIALAKGGGHGGGGHGGGGHGSHGGGHTSGGGGSGTAAPAMHPTMPKHAAAGHSGGGGRCGAASRPKDCDER
jgi:hypothetical protein